MEALFSVKDKRVVITGGAGVLCAAMARSLAEAGAWVCVVDYDAARATTVCEEITRAGGKAFAVESNVLEFIGTKGVLRVAVTEEQLRNALRASSQVKP